MATKGFSRPLRSLLPCRSTSSSVTTTTWRCLNTSQRSTILQDKRALVKPILSRCTQQKSSIRSYADSVSPKTKRKGWFFLRWTWRLAYLSTIGGLVYMGYGIYLLRTPQEQLEADPSKKNLVILGMAHQLQQSFQPLIISRHWLGGCFSTQET